MNRFAAIAALLLAVPIPAWAQSVNWTAPLGFTQVGPTVSLTANTSSQTVKLGWVGVQAQALPNVYACNAGAVVAYVAPVASSSGTAATTSTAIAAGTVTNPSCVLVALNGASYMAAITGSSTATLTFAAGQGALFGGIPGGDKHCPGADGRFLEDHAGSDGDGACERAELHAAAT